MALEIGNQIRFETMTPDGKLKGAGILWAIFPTKTSNWFHVLMESGDIRMLFEATAKIELVEEATA